MHTTLHKVLNKLWYVFAVTVILIALLVSVARLLTPVLNKHRADFEQYASQILEMPVMIGNVKVGWHGYEPEFSLEHVTVLDQKTLKPKVVIQRFEINFSLWQSLLARHVYLSNITLTGMRLTITAQASGILKIGNLASINMKDTLTGASVQTDAMVRWIFSQPLLSLQNIELRYLVEKKPPISLTLNSLSLKNTPTHHIVNGAAILNQELPTKVDLHFAWDGDVRKMEQAQGHFYVYFEGLSLPQWFSEMAWEDLQVKKGIASVKVWANWKNSQWQQMQSKFQVYDLELYSINQKRNEVIDRISGHVGWKRDGKTQIFAAEDILINFPYHLWPTSNIYIQVTDDAEGNPHLRDVRISYLNLVDTYRLLLLKKSLIPDQFSSTLAVLDPKGDIINLELTLPEQVTSPDNVTLKSSFTGLSLNPWQQYPGIGNFKGDVSWDGKQGALNLDSTHALVFLKNLFSQATYFNVLSANMNWHKDEKSNFLLQVSKLHVDNDDGAADVNLSLTLPPVGSPTLDLSADFSMQKAEAISNYLPLKIFDPDLGKWLRGAFLSGKGNTGKVIVQGRLSDFPFDNNTGKFFVSSKITDLNFQFAPGWPSIQHLNGLLVFSGRAMNADVSSGQIMNVPIADVHGVIPYIGDDAPQILHVESGTIPSDLAYGLEFIRSSPLRDTIGKDLAGIMLKGPMQLKLGLIVPIKRPELSQVTGDVTFTDSTLSLPEWKLNLEKMNGGFQFTEKTLTAKSITGELFNSPINLSLSTVTSASKVSLVQADLTGFTTLATLQNWLKADVSAVIKGSANYQAQLMLASHTDAQPSVLSLRSDLKGISVDLPKPYGKKADETKDFVLNIDVDNSQTLKTKLLYAKQISAALTFKKASQGLQLLGGELRLGGSMANWQSAPGILISGQMQQLDWDTWQKYFASLSKSVNSKTPLDFSLLRGVNLDASVINALGQSLHSAHFEATPEDSTWIIDLDSNEIAGRVTLPFRLADRPVIGKFQHINLSVLNSKDRSQLDPRLLPAMQITIGDLQFEGRSLGRVSLNVLSNKSGITIKQLSLEKPLFKLNATGDWAVAGRGSRSHLQGDASTPQASNALKEWGFNSSNFVGSTGSVNFDLSWPDAPYRPTAAGMSGQASIKLGEGRIVQLSEGSSAKMGLGRLLNIFSLSTIPRRLSLDFSDLFEKGYSFDTMSGSFVLRDGDAVTNNMNFNGPIARVDIAGRLGLAAKDLDFKLSITPYVTSSLPVVATIAGGPIAGVATWVVGQVLSQSVSQVTTYTYSVTGPWDNPSWQELGKKPVAVVPQPQAKTVGG